MFSSHGGFLTIAMYHLIKLTQYDETKKYTHDSQIAGVKEKLSHGGLSQRQASDNNQPMKALQQGRH